MAEVWTYHENQYCEIARCSVGDYVIEVVDLDGDVSEWEVKIEGNVIANGSSLMGNHFEAAKAAAWATVHSLESVPTGFLTTLSPTKEE